MRKLSNLHPFFFADFQLQFYCVRIFYYAATESKITDDVTKLVTEYLIPTYSTLVLLIRTFLTKI